MSHEPEYNDHDITDRNIEQLLGKAYQPEEPDPDWALSVRSSLDAAAARRRAAADTRLIDEHGTVYGWPPRMTLYVGWAAAAMLLIGLLVTLNSKPATVPLTSNGQTNDGKGQPVAVQGTTPVVAMAALDTTAARPRWLSALRRPEPTAVVATQPGQTLRTGPRERRRVHLADGSVVYLNENSTLRTLADRHVALDAGEIYLDVAPRRSSRTEREHDRNGTFVVETPKRRLTALGTKFAVTVADKRTDVAVVQGRVRADELSEPISAGQQARLNVGGEKETQFEPAPRLAEMLYWTRDLMAAAEPALVPASSYSGGAVTVKSTDGAEVPLSLRRYHVDVHIEDGFARTTIDQTYFNHLTRREEGTFHFPLPPDASISRLAMYVNGRLMEGGMVERNEGRNVFESIKYRMQDPALLEWIDGTTFKMRVFPIEPRQEKRIILSYTQPVETLGNQTRYRFPIGHSLGDLGQVSAHVLVRGGAEMGWNCATHPLVASREGVDLLLDLPAEKQDGRSTRTELAGDLELTLVDSSPAASAAPRFSSFTHEGYRYLMLRTTPELTGAMRSQRRDWIFVIESSADRSPLIARAQIEIVRGILSVAGYDDTFAVIAAGTRPTLLVEKPLASIPANIEAACEQLGQIHLIGALDLEAAFRATATTANSATAPVIVHIGSGVPALGEQSDNKLAAIVPENAQYVGIAVGRSFNRNLMKLAAAGRRGYFTQINPNEPLTWRATDLVTTLNSPRLLEVRASSSPIPAREGGASSNWLATNDSLTHGEPLCAMTRLSAGQSLPKSVTISGQLDGNPWTREIPVQAVADGAGYLPRQWARLEIYRLLAADGAKNRDAIIKLSKSMYVMSPFTSLLVLENEEMYAQYKVDRGRKDHWAMYSAPAEIPVVNELKVKQESPAEAPKASANANAQIAAKSGRPVKELMSTIARSRGSRAQVQEQLAMLVDHFNILRDQRRFAEAEVNAKLAMEIAPDEIAAIQIWREARFWRYAMNNLNVSDSQDAANWNAWNEVEMAGVPADVTQNIEFLDSNDWAALTEGRRRFRADGTALSPNPRYVRITALPFFSQVGPVTTTTGATTTTTGGTTTGGTTALALLPFPNESSRGPRHSGLVNVVYGDGHVANLSTPIDSSLWAAAAAAGDGLYAAGDDGGFVYSIFGGAGYGGPSHLANTTSLMDANRFRPGSSGGYFEVVEGESNQKDWINGDTDDILAFTIRTQPQNLTISGQFPPTYRDGVEPWGNLSDIDRVALENIAIRRERLALLNEEHWKQSLGSLNSRGPEDRHINAEQDAVLRTLFEVEKSFVPFPDDPPMVYPTPEIWQELMIRRRKYALANQQRPLAAERKIIDQLTKTTRMDFEDARLDDVVGYLQELHGITISLDKAALEAIHVTGDNPVTISVKGKSLRSGLQQLMRQLDPTLTIQVQDEVLMITTKEAATQHLLTTVYPIGDLVVGPNVNLWSSHSRVPYFNHVPYINRLFGHAYPQAPGLNSPITPRIIVQEEDEDKLGLWDVDNDRDGRFDSIWIDPSDQANYDQTLLPKGSAAPIERISSATLLGTTAIRQLNASFIRDLDQRRGTSPVASFTLTDLLGYAPGMATNNFDIQAVLEAEGNEPLPKPGHVDPRAAELIAKARAAGWRAVELRSAEPGAPGASARPLTVRFDGTGRFQYERATIDGLKETVHCDGTNLWHVYPELGVAAQRKFSRVYRGALCQMLPWLLPPVEDLAIGNEVTAIDGRTIAISPRRQETGGLRPPLANKRFLQLRIVFAESGQLEQQQLVDMPAGKVLASVRFAADGAISLHNRDGKELRRRTLKLSPAGAPDVSPPNCSFVIVPLPLRTQAEIAAKAGVKPDSDPATWDDATAIATASVADGPTARKIIQKRFFARGDFRLGFYALLLRHGGEINFSGQPGGKDEKCVRHPLAVDPRSPLARYIADRIGNDATTRPADAQPALGDGLLGQLDQYGALVTPLTRYRTLKPEEQKAQLDILRRSSTEFVRAARSPRLALHVGLLAEQALQDREVHLALADFWGRMSKGSGAGSNAHYERARQLFRAGQVEAARKEFLAYHSAILAAGTLPPIDRDFYEAIVRNEASRSPQRWQKLVDETATALQKRGGAAPTIALAWQCRLLGEGAQADKLVEQALQLKEEKPERQQLTQLLAADYYHRTRQLEKADSLLMKVTSARRAGGVSPPLVPRNDADQPLRPDHSQTKTAGSPLSSRTETEGGHRRAAMAGPPLASLFADARLWHWAAQLAHQRGRFAEAASREHQVLDLIYATPPEKIDLNQLRTNFDILMNRYEKAVEAAAVPGQEPPRELVAAIMAAADQWRNLDNTPDAACQRAAKLLRTLGAKDAAWQYLTTPLAGKAHESAPWVAMAGQLASDGEIDLADTSYRAASQSEPTNPEILLMHANLLRENSRTDSARQLYQKVATGTWQQPRFNWVQQQAQQALDALGPKK